MTTLATHDTKRSEDVRARLAVLSEIPREWHETMARWQRAGPLPDPDFAALFWQTVAGCWPIEQERLRAYAIKAAREASTGTSWASPDPTYEDAIIRSLSALYSDPLRSDVDRFVAEITPYGWSNSLGQKVIQILAPGVPDTYQGTELWDNSLVDPDNRRPVDFAARRELLARLDSGWLPPVDESGAAKLLVTSRALRARRGQPLDRYEPLTVEGPAAAHAVAFDRGGVVALATRLPLGLERRGGWQDTVLGAPCQEFRDAVSGRSFAGTRVAVGEILSPYPVAILVAA
jgi:(1->4)-alpha-D-glucan 1-alpha-D-glucosylmutase